MSFRSVSPASVAPLWIFTRAPVTVPKQPYVGDLRAVTRLYSVESPAGYLTVTNRDEMLSPRRDSDATESGGPTMETRSGRC